jgi:hypothetical protein
MRFATVILAIFLLATAQQPLFATSDKAQSLPNPYLARDLQSTENAQFSVGDRFGFGGKISSGAAYHPMAGELTQLIDSAGH